MPAGQAPEIRAVVDLHVVDRPGMEHSGVGRYAVESTRALCRARPAWRVLVLTGRPELVPEANAEPRGSWVPTRRAWARVAWLHTWSARDARGSRGAVWIGAAFTLPAWRRGPSVVTIHDLVPIEQASTYSSQINVRYAAAALRRAAAQADVVLCGSEHTAGRLTARLRVPRERIRVVPYGVDPEFSAVVRAEADPAFVLYVGAFEPRKGLGVLHAAMRQLNATRPAPVELVLAGAASWGGDQPLLRERWARVVPDPGDSRLRDLYARAAVLVLPSSEEGFGLPVAEALAAGCPVVCSDLPAVREFAGEAPRYVPVGDAGALARALAELLHDPGARERASTAGRAAAAPLRWERVGELLAREVEILGGAA